MNKNGLAIAIAEKTGLTHQNAKNVVDAITETIIEAVQADDKVTLLGFGTFEKRYRNARVGRNPSTGEEIQIAETYAPAFKAAKGFKDAVKGA